MLTRLKERFGVYVHQPEDDDVRDYENDKEVAYLQGKMAFFNQTDFMEYGGRFPKEYKEGFIDAQVEKLEES